jgi:hypothetical protein
VSQLPAPQSLAELADAFERLRGLRPNAEEDHHRRGRERLVLRLAGCVVLTLVGVNSWVAIDPLNRYQGDQRQQGMQALGGLAAALLGAVAGYSAGSDGAERQLVGDAQVTPPLGQWPCPALFPALG